MTRTQQPTADLTTILVAAQDCGYEYSEQADLFDTAAIGSILTDRYPVARTGLNRIWLRTPASAMNAASWLRSQGIDAHAELSGQWHVRIWR